MTHSESGSATLHTLLAAVLLLTALAAATLWSSISTARHKLTAAADLTALSAAQSLAATQSVAITPTEATTNSAPTIEAAPAHGISLSTQGLPAVRSWDADQRPPVAPRATPCETAARTASLNGVRLTGCDVTTNAVTVQVSLELDLPMAQPTLTATARAGPL